MTSDLVPPAILIARYFAAERHAIAALEAELAGIEQQFDEKREEQSGEEGLLAEANEANEGAGSVAMRRRSNVSF